MLNLGGRPRTTLRIPGTSVMRFDSPSGSGNQASRATSTTSVRIIPTTTPQYIAATTASSSYSSPSATRSKVDNNDTQVEELSLIDDYAPVSENGCIRWTALTLNALVSVMTPWFNSIIDSIDAVHKEIISTYLFGELRVAITMDSGDHPDQVQHLNYFLKRLTAQKMKSKWRTMVSNYKKIHRRVMSDASRPDIDWVYYDAINKIVRGDPSIIPPYVYEAYYMDASGAGRTTAQDVGHVNPDKRNNDDDDDDVISSEEIEYDLRGRTFELDTPVSSSNTLRSTRPTSAAIPVTSLRNYTTTTEQLDVLDVEQTRNIVTDLNAESAKRTKDILDDFLSKIRNKSAKRKREYEETEKRIIRRQTAMMDKFDNRHKETMDMMEKLVNLNRSILDACGGNMPGSSTSLSSNNDNNDNNETNDQE